MKISAFFVLLCVYNTWAKSTPSSLKALESEAATPLNNRMAIQEIDEGIEEQPKSKKIPRFANKDDDFIGLLQRLHNFEADVNSIVERFASLMKELKEKPFREHLTALSHSDENLQKHTPQQKGCPDTWEEHDGMCYLRGSQALSWSAALQKCRGYGGTLAEINDYNTNEFFIRTWGAFKSFWLGGKLNYRDEWVWEESGNRIRFDNWYFFDPPTGQYYETCLTVYDGKFKDDDCKDEQKYICQKRIS